MHALTRCIFWHNDTTWLHRTASVLAHVMACCLFGNKLLSKPMRYLIVEIGTVETDLNEI